MCGHHRNRERRRHTTTATAAPQPAPARRARADDTRASDAERDATVSELRTHAAEGRLTIDELDERIAAALAAQTRADLAPVLADLPARPRPVTDRRDVREHVRSYVLVMLLLVAIWALTGAGYFWPIWPILGWGIGVALHASAVGRPHRAST